VDPREFEDFELDNKLSILVDELVLLEERKWFGVREDIKSSKEYVKL
jgi:hypothetical protein